MKLSFMEHLGELRKRLLFLIGVFVVLFVFSFFLIKPGFNFFSTRILEEVNLIVLSPIEILLVQLKLALYLALIFLIPFILYHVIKFVKPGLTRREKKVLVGFLMGVVFLSFLGIFFSYVVIIKIGVPYLASLAENLDVGNYWSVTKALNFIFVSLFSASIVFQFPLVLILLSKLEVVDLVGLKNKRLYVYLFILIFAAVITPPDPFTLVAIALPLILLFEITSFFVKNKSGVG